MTRSLVLMLALVAVAPAHAADPGPPLQAILAVGKEGAGNAAAAAAWKQLVAAGPDAMIPTLTAFDTATPAAANWLRSAVSAVADAEQKAKRPLPAEALRAFVKDAQRTPAARRIAYELYATAVPGEATNLLAELVNDPESDLRRDAIAERLARAAKVSPAALLAAQKELVPFARDRDQLEQLAKALDKAGEPFNKTTHFNYVTQWLVAGPFDNTAEAGYAKAYPPETQFDAKAEYPGKLGPVAWKAMQSADEYGTINLNQEIGKVKFAVAYAYAVVEAPAATPVEVRATSPNALQIFLNGEKIYDRNAYHNGRAADAHVAKGTLKPGRNTVLLKVCQDDQKQPWTQGWEFAARISDATGGRVPLQQSLTTPTGETQLVPLGTLKVAPAPEQK